MKRIIIGGRGMGEGLGLDSLMGLLAGAGRESGPCGGPEGLESHNCDECLIQGECPIESRMRERKKGQVEVSGADDVKSADLLMAQAKIAGMETEVNALQGFVSQFRGRVDKMAAAHKTELERLAGRNKEELERLSRRHDGVLQNYERLVTASREENRELSRELESALHITSSIKTIIASNGNKRPSKETLAVIREALGMPPLENTKKATAPVSTDKGEGAGG